MSFLDMKAIVAVGPRTRRDGRFGQPAYGVASAALLWPLAAAAALVAVALDLARSLSATRSTECTRSVEASRARSVTPFRWSVASAILPFGDRRVPLLHQLDLELRQLRDLLGDLGEAVLDLLAEALSGDRGVATPDLDSHAPTS